jgi:hypothetical protein
MQTGVPCYNPLGGDLISENANPKSPQGVGGSLEKRRLVFLLTTLNRLKGDLISRSVVFEKREQGYA